MPGAWRPDRHGGIRAPTAVCSFPSPSARANIPRRLLTGRNKNGQPVLAANDPGGIGACLGHGGRRLAQDKLKVAAIYTVPVEQQWVSRIHQALNAAKDRGEITYVWSENVANTDYERVMREYAEAGNQLILGEVFGVERAARQVAKDYPQTAFLMGSSFGPQEPNFSAFDNYIQECFLSNWSGCRKAHQV